MPQPILAEEISAIKLEALQVGHRAAIGSVAIHWAHLESALALCFSKLAGASIEAAFIALQNMSAKNKVDTVGALGIVTLPPHLQEEFADLVTQANNFSVKRNGLVHNQWLGIDKKGRAVCLIISGRLNGPNVKYTAWTTAELEQVADDLKILFEKIKHFLVDNKMWSGDSFE